MTSETKYYPGAVIQDPDTENEWEILDHNLAKETAWAYVWDKAQMAEIGGLHTKLLVKFSKRAMWKDHLAVVVTPRLAIQRFGGNYYLLLLRER